MHCAPAERNDDAPSLNLTRALRAVTASPREEYFQALVRELAHRSLISEIAQCPEQREMVHAITSLARTLNLQVVAEGVESAEQLDMLRATGVEHAQGFYLSHPRAPQDVTLHP